MAKDTRCRSTIEWSVSRSFVFEAVVGSVSRLGLSRLALLQLDERRRTKASVLEKTQRHFQNCPLQCRSSRLVKRVTMAKRKEKRSGWTYPLRHFAQQLQGHRGDALSF